MTDPVRDVLLTSTAWLDQFWDEEAGLIWTVKRDRHLVRETSAYALGLLQRGDAGDEARALRATTAVLEHQFVGGPGTFEGTFRRAPEEPDPPDEPVMWIHYDPNWRQFIGTTLAAIYDRYELPADLRESVFRAITLAVTGEPADRVVPTYANIALMKAWLECWYGERANDPQRFAGGESLGAQVASHFHIHDAFLEYNSPTYYGIDLWALGLWRDSPSRLAELGPPIESAMWRDLARFYHADLRNVCGPFDRAYGMDMTRYAATLGIWMWAAVGRERAPFPDPSQRFGHPHDFSFGTLFAALGGPRIPDDALPELLAFSGERLVDRTISNEPFRHVTAWLGPQAMIGAQTGPASGIGWLQHHHATMHLRIGRGDIACVRLLPDVVANARAAPGELEIDVISSPGPITFEISGTSADHASISRNRWELDDGGIDIETDASDAAVRVERGRLLASYDPAATRFVLRL